MRDFIGNEARFRNMVRFRKAFLGITKDVVVILFQVVGLVIVDQISLRRH